MRIFHECLPCTLRQVLSASRNATDDISKQNKIMEKAISILADFNYYQTAPELARAMHQSVKEITNNPDPYKNIKEHSISEAKKIHPFMKSHLDQQEDKLYWALKIAATGNIIDAAIYENIDIKNSFKKELLKEFAVLDIEILKNKLENAKNSYLLEHSKIISSGSSAPGTILKECSNEFLKELQTADVIISKGQGNYESLSDSDYPIFFLLKAKCPMVANHLQVKVNDYVMLFNSLENH